MNAPILWVDGNIASGKSTLVNQLGEALGYRVFQEPVADEERLSLFYQDPKRWAFSFQIEMLRKRWAIQELAMLECRVGNIDGCILDRGMPGDHVFAYLHYVTGNISRLEWETYNALFAEFMSVPQLQPSILVYLDAKPAAALERLKKRSRPGEELVPIEYLEKLASAYEVLLRELSLGTHLWSHGMKVLRIEWSTHNLPIDPIIQKIKALLQPPIRQARVVMNEIAGA